MENTILTSDGLKNALKKFTIEESIAEYIWNGFDANANTVTVFEKRNALSGSLEIVIEDDGYGIIREELDKKFRPVFQSEKQIRELFKDPILLKGKKGVGRLSFFNIAAKAIWETVYTKADGKNYFYSIEVNENHLIGYNPSTEVETSKPTGTKVTLILNGNIDILKISAYLKMEYAWFLKVYSDKKIIINNFPLDCSELLAQEDHKQGVLSDQKTTYSIDIYIWTNKLNKEYSKYYFLDSSGTIKHKENTTLNNKGDNFFHSVIVKTELFNEFDFSTTLPDNNLIGVVGKSNQRFGELKYILDEFLYSIRKPYIRKYAKKYINTLKSKKLYPDYVTNNPVDKFKEQQLDDLVSDLYYFAPSIFNSLSNVQKKTLLRMFDLIMNSGEVDNLFKIVDEVVELSKEERSELADILDKASLSNILSMQKLVIDRLQAIADFKELLFNEERYVNEIDHIQKFVEQHYWIFGEQYHLVTAEEPNFEEALRRFRYITNKEIYWKGELSIPDLNAKKQMDIFAVQQLCSGKTKKVIVVELKRPSVIIGENELLQLKKYFNVINKEDRFNATNIEWEFYLVGNSYNEDIKNEIESNKAHGEHSLAFKVRNLKIYVKSWSELFTELELSYNYLNEKLKLDQEQLVKKTDKTSNEIVYDQVANSATMPTEIQVPPKAV